MNEQALEIFWKKEEERSFVGWDFSSIHHRTEEEALPWDYKEIVKSHLKSDLQLLDMGTGGGEFLLGLAHPYHLTSVTEAYLPNYELCQQKLGTLGINVQLVEDDHHLSFEDNSFDIIINRHEAYDFQEIHRLLKPGGIFITQQVGRWNNYEFSKMLLQDFTREPIGTNDFSRELEEAEQLGFEIRHKAECFPYLRFFDVGALVYFAKIIEWEFPEFSVKRCMDQLVECHALVEKNGYVESTEHRYLIVAEKKN